MDAACWFCGRLVSIDYLIAGYDTWDEQRLACDDCDRAMKSPRVQAAIRAESDERVRVLREAAQGVVPAWDIAVLAAYEGGYGAVPAEFGALADTIAALRAALDAAPEDAP